MYVQYLTTEPSPPENITVINKTCNSLSVQWSPPSDTGGLAITGYTVDVPENLFTTKTTMTRTDITNLSPGTTYRVKVETITVFKSKYKSTNITTHSRSKYECRHCHQMSTHYYYPIYINIIIPSVQLLYQQINYNFTYVHSPLLDLT